MIYPEIIKLTQGKVTFIDQADYNWLSKWKWYAFFSNGRWYAASSITKGGITKIIFMHRLIMNTPDEKETDHKDRNGLNNQRENIRVCTHGQNQMNKTHYGISKFGGVCYDKSKSKWRSRITYEGIRYSLGYYDYEEDAAKAYDVKAVELFKEFANLNFKENGIPSYQ